MACSLESVIPTPTVPQVVTPEKGPGSLQRLCRHRFKFTLKQVSWQQRGLQGRQPRAGVLHTIGFEPMAGA